MASRWCRLLDRPTTAQLVDCGPDGSSETCAERFVRQNAAPGHNIFFVECATGAEFVDAEVWRVDLGLTMLTTLVEQVDIEQARDEAGQG